MVIFTPNNWVRQEGLILPVADYNYSSSVSGIGSTPIWYTDVAIKMQNVQNYVHGVHYKMMTFSELGYNSIEEIAANFDAAKTAMVNGMKENLGALIYSVVFSVSESCIIQYGEPYGQYLQHTLVILIDKNASTIATRLDRLKSISATYEGPNIPITKQANPNHVYITGYKNDGSTLHIATNLCLIKHKDNPSNTNLTIDNLGTNIYEISYTDSYGNVFKCPLIINGILEQAGIIASYSGPSVPIGKSVLRKYITVVAYYTDGSSSTVTDWSFTQGDVVTATNNGVLEIIHSSFTCDLIVNHHATVQTLIKAYYKGPNIEKGKDFDVNDVVVKVFDTGASTGTWEVLPIGSYDLDTTTVSNEGDNVITVTYINTTGETLITTFLVKGIQITNEIALLIAEYEGPPIHQGMSYSITKVKVIAYWLDGKITEIGGFAVDSTVVESVGDNTFTAFYMDASATFVVQGAPVETTSGQYAEIVQGNGNYTPIKVELKYPKATYQNSRYRGPAESLKADYFAMYVHENLTKLFDIYNSLERMYKDTINEPTSLFNTSIDILSTCTIMDDKMEDIS